MLCGYRGRDPDPGQVVLEEVSLGWSLQEQMEKGPPHQGMSVQKDERGALGKTLLARWGQRRDSWSCPAGAGRGLWGPFTPWFRLWTLFLRTH